MKHPLTRILIAITLLALAFSALGVTPALAASPFVVTKTADTNDGTCNSDCSLREAIVAANTLAGDDTITVPTGNYMLTITGTDEDAAATGDLDITSNITLNGAGAGSTIIQAGTLGVGGPPNGIDRVFHITNAYMVNMSGVTIKNGNSATGNGGGISNSGMLTLMDSTLSGNSADAGGGIYNEFGALTITNSTLSGNSAHTGLDHSGGGIYNTNGTLMITNSTFSGNSAGDSGGGIFIFGGTLMLTNSTLSGNSAQIGSGGGIISYGTLTITDSTLSGNSVPNYGGGIYTDGAATVTNSTFLGNSAQSGGGIFNYNNIDTLTITHSILGNNSVTGDGGGIYNQIGIITITNSTLPGNSAGDSGGGLYNAGGTLTVKNSTLSGNSAAENGGGVSNGAAPGTITITNSTLTNNSATGKGGGIYDKFDTLTITNSTLSANSAAVGGGMYNDNGGGALNYANTIIANSTAGGDCSSVGSITTNTNNLVEDGTCSAALSGDPKLGPLASNGGPTQTLALLAGSKAIDAGKDSVCAAAPVSNKDQRGVTRPKGAHCDIGSYETDAAPPSTLMLYSFGPQDGQMIESSENSNQGGLANTSSTTLYLGDDAQRKQYRGMLSFNTGANLPDNATITNITLKFKKQAIIGSGNPVAIFQGFVLDIKKGVYGTTALQASDFQAAANISGGPYQPAPVNNWYSINLTFARNWINKLSTNSGLTQIRLRFNRDDNNNVAANYLSLYSGNAPAADRPQLVITYFVP